MHVFRTLLDGECELVFEPSELGCSGFPSTTFLQWFLASENQHQSPAETDTEALQRLLKEFLQEPKSLSNPKSKVQDMPSAEAGEARNMA